MTYCRYVYVDVRINLAMGSKDQFDNNEFGDNVHEI
jgi:hypothetical protein